MATFAYLPRTDDAPDVAAPSVRHKKIVVVHMAQRPIAFFAVIATRKRKIVQLARPIIMSNVGMPKSSHTQGKTIPEKERWDKLIHFA